MRKTSSVITAVLFAAVLLIVPLCWLCLPEKTFSESERRYLAEAPKLSEQALKNWSFDDAVEGYLADHLPLRDTFVGINAYATLFSGRQVSGEIWRDRDGYLVEAPVDFNYTEVARRVEKIASLSKTTGTPVSVLIVPSTGYIRSSHLPPRLATLYRDNAVLKQFQQNESIRFVPLAARFSREGQDWYYRTDHHWTADGAFAAYEAYMETAGHTPLARDAFTRRALYGYTGSTRSRSALWLTKPDTLMIDAPASTQVKVTFSDDKTVYDSLFFEEHLKEYDWYPVFIDGNHPVTVIENLSAPDDAPVLLMVKDSFGNTLAPLLVPSYRTVVMVDQRFYRGAVSDLCFEYKADEILFCYSIERISTDLNLLLLK